MLLSFFISVFRRCIQINNISSYLKFPDFNLYSKIDGLVLHRLRQMLEQYLETIQDHLHIVYNAL